MALHLAWPNTSSISSKNWYYFTRGGFELVSLDLRVDVLLIEPTLLVQMSNTLLSNGKLNHLRIKAMSTLAQILPGIGNFNQRVNN